MVKIIPTFCGNYIKLFYVMMCIKLCFQINTKSKKVEWTSSYATMVHGRGCNPHRSTTTFANLEITWLWRHWWRRNSETIRDREKRRPPRHEILWAIQWWKPHRCATTFAKPEMTSLMTS